MPISYQETVQVVLNLVREKEEAEAIVKQQAEYIKQREGHMKTLELKIATLEMEMIGLRAIRETDRLKDFEGKEDKGEL